MDHRIVEQHVYGVDVASPEQVLIADNRTAAVLAVVILVGFCLLVPTNGIGSNMVVGSFIYLIWRERELRLRWWRLSGRLLLVAIPYLFLLGAFAFSPRHGLKAAWASLNGLCLGYLAFYLACLGSEYVRQAVIRSVLLLAALAIALVLYNIYHYGLAQVISLGGLETTVNRNRTGQGLGFSFVLAVVGFIVGQGWRERVLMLLAGLVIAAVAVINNSRGALLGMALTSLVLGLVWNWRVVLLWVALAGGLGIMLYIAHGTGDAALAHNGSMDNGRFDIWRIVWWRIQERPWLGYGLHAMPQDPVLNVKYPALMQGHPHSIYLELVYASGLFGVFFWLCWCARLGQLVRRHFPARNAVAHYIGLAWLVYTLVHGSVDFEFYGLLVPSMLAFGTALIFMRRPVAPAGPGVP